METQTPPSLKNAAFIATAIVLAVLAVTVYLGRHFTCDWPTIWAAVTGIGAFVALAALFAAAIYARAQYQESLRNSKRETLHAEAELDQARATANRAALHAETQLEQARSAAKSAAVLAEAQLVEAKQANKATHDFEKVRLTREIINEYIDLSYHLGSLRNGSWENTKKINGVALAGGNNERIALKVKLFDAVADCAALYAANVLAKDIFLRRAAAWLLIGWYLYGEYAIASAAEGVGQLSELSLLIHDSVNFQKEHQPMFFKSYPETNQMLLPDPPSSYSR